MAPKDKAPAAKPTSNRPPRGTDAYDDDALDRVQATPPPGATDTCTGVTTRPPFEEGEDVVWYRDGDPARKRDATIISTIVENGEHLFTVRDRVDRKRHIVPEKDLFHLAHKFCQRNKHQP